MSVETRKKDADAILDLLAKGPKSADQLRAELTKRRTEEALHHLGVYARVEYVWPSTSPLTYKIAPNL